MTLILCSQILKMSCTLLCSFELMQIEKQRKKSRHILTQYQKRVIGTVYFIGSESKFNPHRCIMLVLSISNVALFLVIIKSDPSTQ